jgi:hypothetical protein
MPIEDVQHLLRNSVSDCATIFVDSTKRDYVHYPTPSEYVVDLLEPVKNVFGIDVLDAAIANCMYNVDVNNCRARVIGINVDLCTSLQTARVTQVPEASRALLTASQFDEKCDQADLSALCSEFFALGFASPLRGWMADVTHATYMVCVLDPANAVASAALLSPIPASTPASLAVDVALHSNTYCYALVETRVTSVPMLVTTSSSASVAAGWIPFNGAHYKPSDPSQVAAAIAAPGGFAIEPTTSSSSTTHTLYDVVTYVVKQMAFSDYSMLSGVAPTVLQFSIGTATIEIGNYNGGGMLQASAQDAFVNCTVTNPIYINATSQSGIGKQGIMRFEAPRNFRFMFSTVDSSAASVLGFDLETSPSVNMKPTAQRTFGAVQVGGHRVPLYCSVLRSQSQMLDAPGLANLLGVRYIALRCPEIEQYICTTGKYGPFSVGIGVFKLASTNEVGQVRFDYVSLVHKPFHPIGKLTRFTLRFELADGSLYDFKGINNQLLLSLKYYTPTPAAARANQSVPHVVSLLNPDYDPDFMAYMARQSGYAPRLEDAGYDPYDEDDESQNDDDDVDTRGSRGSQGDDDGDFDGDDDDFDCDDEPPYEDDQHPVAMRDFNDEVQRRVIARERSAIERFRV